MRKRFCSRVQSVPSSDSKTSIQEHLPQIPADHLSNVLDAAIDAQKMGLTLTLRSINPTTGTTDWNFINCYLDNTVQLLDACKNIQHRLENIQGFLRSIPIGLHCLEGEHERGAAVMRRAAAALEFSCSVDRRHGCKTEKSMSGIITSGKKLSFTYQDASGSMPPELHKALTGSWAMAVLAIGKLTSATSFNKVEPWRKMRNVLSKKIKLFHKKSAEAVLMEELKVADLAVQTLLKFTLGSGRRTAAVKAVVGELQSRREQLEKTLPQLELKIDELYRLIVGLRMSIFGLLSEAQMKGEVGLGKPKYTWDVILNGYNYSSCQKLECSSNNID